MTITSNSSRADKLTNIILILAILLVGIGHMAVLPPFEGFDETGHYSYMREIAETGQAPVLGNSDLDDWVFKYREIGPYHYLVDERFKDETTITYPEFFNSKTLPEAFVKNVKAPPPFIPGQRSNWQAQHPPFYFLIMAGVTKLTNSLSFTTQMFLLRLFSFLMAVGGLLIGWRATRDYFPATMRHSIDKAYLLYPLMVPMFFPEFGRLGNDSLCALIMGVTWHSLLQWYKDEHSIKNNLTLGLSMAWGLMTKAFFIPITAGFVLLALARFWPDRKNKELMRDRIDNLVLISAPVLFAGFWYLRALLRTSSLINHGSFIVINKQGGLLQIIAERGYPVLDLMRNLMNIFFSWIWVGTQSLAVMSIYIRAPLCILIVLLFIPYFRKVRRSKPREMPWVPMLLIAPFLAGLLYHAFALAAMQEMGTTPGWYLSIMMPVFSFALVYTFEYLKTKPFEQKIINPFMWYAVVFLAVQAWMQMSLFSGCAGMTGHDDRRYAFPNGKFCLDRFHEVINRLSVIGWPKLAVLAYGIGILCFAVGLWRMTRSRRQAIATATDA